MEKFKEKYIQKQEKEVAMKMKISTIIAVVFSGACVISAMEGIGSDSLSDSGSVLELRKMVITATRTKKVINEAPAVVTVVDSKEIKGRGIKTVDEALKLVTGVYNQRSKGLMESMPGTVMRGFAGADKVLVLLDGQPMGDGYTGRTQFNNVAVDDIERIEVVKGAFSSLYGGNAVGGVINIITKTSIKQSLNAKASYGTNKSYTFSASYGNYLFDRLSVGVSISQKHSDGYVSDLVTKKAKAGTSTGTTVTGAEPTTNSTGTDYFVVGNKGINGAENTSFGLKLGLELNEKQHFTYSGNYTWYGYWRDGGTSILKDSLGHTISSGKVTVNYGDTTAKISIKDYNFIGGDSKRATNYHALGYSNELSDKVSLKLKGGLTHHYKNWYVSPKSSATKVGGAGELNFTPSLKGNFDATVELQEILPLNNIVVGLAVTGTQMNSYKMALTSWKDIESTTDTLHTAAGNSGGGAIFLQDEFMILKDKNFVKALSLYAGIRFDYWKVFTGRNKDHKFPDKVNNEYETRDKSAVSPKVSLLFSGTTENAKWAPVIRASIGKSFRPPTAYELYKTWVSAWGKMYESNPDLDPELSWSGEIGTVQNFLDNRISIGITGYKSWVTDMIYNMTDPNNSKMLRRINAGKAEMSGFETELVISPIENWSFFANYTKSNAKITESPTDTASIGKQLTKVPKHKVGFGTTAGYKDMTLFVGGQYASKRYGKSNNSDTVSNVYTARDAFVTVDSRISYDLNEHISFAVTVDNLFDYKYYDYYIAPGRSFAGEISVAF